MTATILDHFLRYVVIATQSDPASSPQPTTGKQPDLGRVLVAGLLPIVLADAPLA
ncbi:peptidase T, partial [Rhizobium ruizarguesonis]